MANPPNEKSRVIGVLGHVGVRWVAKLILALVAVTITLIVIVGFVPGYADGDESSRMEVVGVEGREKAVPRGRLFDDNGEYASRMRKIREEDEAYARELRQRVADQQALALMESNENESEQPEDQQNVRKVKRFVWESPADARGQVWNVPVEESQDAVLTAFLRICIAEADGHPQDCVGIWQVMSNIRRRGCERGHVRRITECDESGETMLSVMRRSQRHIMGIIPLRNKRAGWVRNIEPSCDVPEGWTGSDNEWDSRYESRCQYAVELGRALIANSQLPQRPGHRLEWLPGHPITWGGRCESKRGSCDDRIACSRGLSRIVGTDTENAFWRRPTTPDEVDPICVQLGYGHLVSSEDEQEEENPVQEDDSEPLQDVDPVATSEPSSGHIDDPT